MYEGDKRLGDFAIVREIGRGGMGIVYEARQISLYRRVALKVLSGSLRLTPKAVKRFRREAEAAAKLHHTNIVPVYSIGEEDGTHFYSMELIEGPSLDHVIRQLRDTSRHTRSGSTAAAEDEPLAPELAQTGAYVEGARTASTAAGLSSSSLGSGTGYFDTVARMIAEVADALEYAHQEGVIHRDMKPSNLLLSPTGRLSVNDFGLARMDLRMKVMSGVEANRRVKAEFPDCRVIVLTTFDDDEDVFAALRAGAIGYLLKDAPTDRLVEAIQLAHQGESVLQPSVAAKVVAEFSRSPAKSSEQLVEIESLLSDREFAVLRHLVGGLSNKEIAKQMRISEGTVKNYMTSILDKLGVQDRTQAALKAQAAGLAP